jgi:hypothetical protein
MRRVKFPRPIKTLGGKLEPSSLQNDHLCVLEININQPTKFENYSREEQLESAVLT